MNAIAFERRTHSNGSALVMYAKPIGYTVDEELSVYLRELKIRLRQEAHEALSLAVEVFPEWAKHLNEPRVVEVTSGTYHGCQKWR